VATVTVVAWACVGCGLAVVVVRRRSTAIAFVTLQSLLLSGAAFARVPERSTEFLVASTALLLKAVAVAALLLWTVKRTRENQPIVNDLSAILRLVVAVAVALVAAATVPGFRSGAPSAEHAAVALVAIGITVTALRRATLLQALGLLIAENGVATIATAARGGVPLLIELGALFDLMIIVTIATAFHGRIFDEFGSGDSSALKGLRD
jgi:hydrogenase-4 component E